MVSEATCMDEKEKKNPKCKKCRGGWVTVYNPNSFTYVCDCIINKRTPKMRKKILASVIKINTRFRGM